MYVSSLAVRRFRGFEDARIDLPPSGVALIVGPNNAGKSALLNALDVVAAIRPGERMRREGSPDAPEIEATFRLTDLERNSLFADEEMAQRWPEPWLREWRLSFGAVNEREAFISGLAIQDGDGVFAEISVQEMGLDGQFQWRALDLGGLLGSYPGGASWDLTDRQRGGPANVFSPGDVSVFANLLADWRKGYYHFEALRSAAPRDAASHGAEFLSPNGADLSQALLHLFTDRNPAWDSIVAAMQALVPDVGELATPVLGDKVEAVFIDPYTGARRNIKDLGTGVEQLLLTVYVGVRGERSRFIAIEEPETNLHPAAQRALMRYLRDWSKERVFLLATHSTVFLDEEFGQEAIYLVDRRAGVSTVRAAEPDFRDVLSSLGVSLSDVMSADKIILVEGRSDAEILRSWFPAIAVSRGVAIADMGGSDRAWHVEILLAALEEIDHFDRTVLVVRDRDELSAGAIARLEANAVVRLLSRRELENYLLDHGAAYQALCIRADELGSSTSTPASRQEVADKMKEAADSLRSVIALKRVVADLPSPRLVDRSDARALAESANPLDDLVALVTSRVTPADALERSIRTEWARVEREIDVDWERNWLTIAPGADVLARVWKAYGARYEKQRDGVLIAQQMAPSDEIKELLRQFVGQDLIP